MKQRKLSNQELLDEAIYKKQIILSHCVLGKDVVPKYDTGEAIE